jgi:hypothetical protein
MQIKSARRRDAMEFLHDATSNYFRSERISESENPQLQESTSWSASRREMSPQNPCN